MYIRSTGWAGILAWILLACPATAQDIGPLSSDLDNESLALRTVPLPMMEAGPDAIVRRHIEHIEAHEVGSVSHHVRKAVTIFSRQGRDAFGRIHLFHDSFRSIDHLDGWILDAEGTVVAELDDDDLRDYPANDGFSLYRDLRVTIAGLNHSTYPHTIVFEYTVDREGHLDWPVWQPHHQSASVEHAQYMVDTPEAMQVHYDLRRGAPEPETHRHDDRRVHTWTVRSADAWKAELHGPPWHQQAPAVHVAPHRFAISDTEGTFASWSAFGDWYYGLTEGRQGLSPASTVRAHEVVEEAATRRDSVQALYEYMQDHTRYVSVQLGLGGWQPFDAGYVERTGYGDCKALSNYMQALLEEVGIQAFPVLIHGGSNPPELRDDFPENRFNHMILAVPVEQDTLWLETTSQLLPFGHVPRSIKNRRALLVREEGSHLVELPSSQPEANQRTRVAEVQLTSSGDATASITNRYTGIFQDTPRHRLTNASARARMEWLRDQIRFSTFQIVDADFASVDARERAIRLPVTLDLPRHAAATPSRLFVELGLRDRTRSVPDEPDDRRIHPVHGFTAPAVYTDSVTYVLPDGYGVEALSGGTVFEAPFATYTVTVTHEAPDQIVYVRHFKVREAVLRPDYYERYRKLLRQMHETDAMQAVLVKQ
ncbi:MAG: DUF3857 domain-containing protein [Longimonas sp.]|uniref:DUF3857 domain-containing protein n=1 Tax=Longimonas sp. TaxID=2039626 RepID=UPI003357FAB8